MAATLSSSRHSNRTQQNQLGQAANSFVFGSSTPRELSHISTVSRRERLIDTKLKPKPHPADGEKRDIIYYMRQARSIECKASTRKGLPQNYAFGSSTPRSLSHLNKLAKEQRVYDAKMEKRKSDAAQRSETNPQLFRLTYGQRQSLSKVDDEEASSEPDIIQHRQKEFGLLGSRAANRKEKAESPVESRKPSKSKQAGNIERKSVKSKMTEAGEDSDGEEKVNELPLDLMQNHHRAVSKEVIVAEDDKSQTRMRELLEPLAAEVQKAVPVQQQIVRERDESSE